jgi:hypothetical protein
MKLSKIADYLGLLEKILDEQEIVAVEMNEFVIKVEVTWDVFVNYLKLAERPECYGRLDKKDNCLVLSFRYDDNLVLVTKKQL